MLQWSLRLPGVYANLVNILNTPKQADGSPRRPPLCVQVSITDTGIGLPLPIQEKIFAPFYQYGNLLNAKPAGAGLGLTIAKYYAELHGGTLSVASKGEGQGSQFRLTLPLHDQCL